MLSDLKVIKNEMIALLYILRKCFSKTVPCRSTTITYLHLQGSRWIYMVYYLLSYWLQTDSNKNNY